MASPVSQLYSPTKIYYLYGNFKGLHFRMPGGWNDTCISIFVEACRMYADDLKKKTTNEHSKWRRIALFGRQMSNKTALFTINSCMEVAQCIKRYVIRNRSMMAQDKIFNSFYDAIEDLLEYFPSEPDFPRSRSMSTDETTGTPEDHFEDALFDLVYKNIRFIKNDEPSIWIELSSIINDRFDMSCNIKEFLKCKKENVIMEAMKVDDPSERKIVFCEVGKRLLPVFDYIEPKNVQKNSFLDLKDENIDVSANPELLALNLKDKCAMSTSEDENGLKNKDEELLIETFLRLKKEQKKGMDQEYLSSTHEIRKTVSNSEKIEPPVIEPVLRGDMASDLVEIPKGSLGKADNESIIEGQSVESRVADKKTNFESGESSDVQPSKHFHVSSPTKASSASAGRDRPSQYNEKILAKNDLNVDKKEVRILEKLSKVDLVSSPSENKEESLSCYQNTSSDSKVGESVPGTQFVEVPCRSSPLQLSDTISPAQLEKQKPFKKRGHCFKDNEYSVNMSCSSPITDTLTVGHSIPGTASVNRKEHLHFNPHTILVNQEKDLMASSTVGNSELLGHGRSIVNPIASEHNLSIEKNKTIASEDKTINSDIPKGKRRTNSVTSTFDYENIVIVSDHEGTHIPLEVITDNKEIPLNKSQCNTPLENVKDIDYVHRCSLEQETPRDNQLKNNIINPGTFEVPQTSKKGKCNKAKDAQEHIPGEVETINRNPSGFLYGEKKKKRGRPRKQIQRDIKSMNSSLSESEREKFNVEMNKPLLDTSGINKKRKRGRPRKMKVDSLQTESLPENPLICEKTNSFDDDLVRHINSSVKEKNIPAIMKPVVQKKKRERPPKNRSRLDIDSMNAKVEVLNNDLVVLDREKRIEQEAADWKKERLFGNKQLRSKGLFSLMEPSRVLPTREAKKKVCYIDKIRTNNLSPSRRKVKLNEICGKTDSKTLTLHKLSRQCTAQVITKYNINLMTKDYFDPVVKLVDFVRHPDAIQEYYSVRRTQNINLEILLSNGGGVMNACMNPVQHLKHSTSHHNNDSISKSSSSGHAANSHDLKEKKIRSIHKNSTASMSQTIKINPDKSNSFGSISKIYDTQNKMQPSTSRADSSSEIDLLLSGPSGNSSGKSCSVSSTSLIPASSSLPKNCRVSSPVDLTESGMERIVEMLGSLVSNEKDLKASDFESRCLEEMERMEVILENKEEIANGIACSFDATHPTNKYSSDKNGWFGNYFHDYTQWESSKVEGMLDNLMNTIKEQDTYLQRMEEFVDTL